MKIALQPTTEVGIKAGRLLLGERDLETIGVLDSPVADRDPRVRSIDTVEGFDVIVTDDPEVAVLDQAIAASVPLVARVDAEDLDLGDVDIPVMTGANLATGVAQALAAREEPAQPTSLVVAWTEPGKALRSGEPITFPDPVGARWGRVRRRSGTTTHVVVPIADEWAGAVVRITNNQTTRILGIADLAIHLESLALVAGAVTMGSGTHPAGRVVPSDDADDFLFAALRAGLDIASFTKS